MKMGLNEQQAINRVRFVYKLQLVGLLCYFFAIPIGNAVITHLVIWAGALLSLLTVAFGINLIKITPAKVLTFFALIFNILIQILFHVKQLDLDLIYSCFCFASLFLMLEISQNLVLDRDTLNFACVAFTLIALLICLYSFFPFAYKRTDGTLCPYLTLNLGNANYAGIIVLCTLLMLVGFRQNYRKKAPFLLLIFFLLYLLFKTGSRSCIVAIIVYIIFSIFFRRSKMPNWLSTIMILIPMVWVFVYMFLYQSSSGYVSVLGKNFFSGRQNIYSYFLHIIDSPLTLLFGDLFEARLQNAHNAPLAIFCSVGVVGIISFYGLIRYLLCRTKQQEHNTQKNIALFSIWGILIASSFEASLFLGGFPGVVFMYTFFILLSQSRQTNKNGGAQNESRILQQFFQSSSKASIRRT